MRIQLIAILALFTVLTYSCFEADQPVPPYFPSNNVTTIRIDKSIYDYQVYVDFGKGAISEEHENSSWVLRFLSSDSANIIRINTGDLWAATATGSINFDSIFSATADYAWLSDKSDGNPDSIAIRDWMTDTANYTNEVFLIGQYTGTSYYAEKKLQFIYADRSIYTFRIADLDEDSADTIVITRNIDVNYMYYSIENNEVQQLEPKKEDWDIVFSQYYTILYTDDSLRAPYYVRGVLLNPYKVEAAIDSLNGFEDITYESACQLNFCEKQDAIGHDWKSVAIDQASNSAEYKVRPGYNYIIKDTNDILYKIKFKSYLSQSGIKGYPSFEYVKLEPEK